MMELHVGRGTDRGALTVFPVWASEGGSGGYRCDLAAAEIAEQADGPAVDSLAVSNAGSLPLLMLEGQLVEGGWQNRMLTRSVLSLRIGRWPSRWPVWRPAVGTAPPVTG